MICKTKVFMAFIVVSASAFGCSTNETQTSQSAGSSGSTEGSGGSMATSSSSGDSSSSSSNGGSSGVGGSSGIGGSGGMGGAGGIGGAGGVGGGGGSMGTDADGDGWTVTNGDCCDTPEVCADPTSVNPGGMEVQGNGIDDDCDPLTSDTTAPADCGPMPLQAMTSASDLVKAMDLCQFTTESPAPSERKWGVIQAELALADGSTVGPPNDLQLGVLAQYGPNVKPKNGATMAALSTGTARALGDPGYVAPQNGTSAGQIGNYNANTQVSIPVDYLAAHGGTVPSPATCPMCTGPDCSQAFDSVLLRARIRVPTNAKSFSYHVKYYSSEYPEFLCQRSNDFFLALLQSNVAEVPMDKNIAFDSKGLPLSVNNGFFDVCFPEFGAPPGTCASGTLELVGTGMGGWGTNIKDGGGTQWLRNDAPVVPGETMEIRFVLWDAYDHNLDSVILLDNFRFKTTSATVRLQK